MDDGRGRWGITTICDTMLDNQSLILVCDANSSFRFGNDAMFFVATGLHRRVNMACCTLDLSMQGCWRWMISWITFPETTVRPHRSLRLRCRWIFARIYNKSQMPLTKKNMPSQPDHIIVSPSMSNPRTVPMTMEPPMMIGILCVAWTPMPEMQKLRISAKPTARPAMHDQNKQPRSNSKLDVPPFLIIVIKISTLPKIVAVDCSTTPVKMRMEWKQDEKCNIVYLGISIMLLTSQINWHQSLLDENVVNGIS